MSLSHIWNDKWVSQGRSQHRAQEVTNADECHARLFYVAIDMQLQELNVYGSEI